jgi:hypothetical protein
MTLKVEAPQVALLPSRLQPLGSTLTVFSSQSNKCGINLWNTTKLTAKTMFFECPLKNLIPYSQFSEVDKDVWVDPINAGLTPGMLMLIMRRRRCWTRCGSTEGSCCDCNEHFVPGLQELF